MSSINPSWMEPMLVPEENQPKLEDLAFQLTQRAGKLSSQAHPLVLEAVGGLVRSMNCYYSNLIEGHNTHPRDIDSALKRDYSTDIEKRNLQLEAVAHIRVQRAIDEGSDPSEAPASAAYIQWLHREFCRHLPDELLQIGYSDSEQKVDLIPGEFRQQEVVVGAHYPPPYAEIPAFLHRFEQVYANSRLSSMRRLIAIPAAHHRFLWVHPFMDGNGRVARLMAHAMLKRLDIGSSLWSVARGLARNHSDYKQLLMNADADRRGDLDGRGNLSLRSLVEFSEFFLTVCIDQVDFMQRILTLSELQRRMEIYVKEEVDAKRLPNGSFRLLREALLQGRFERGQAEVITGYRERMARNALSALIGKALLISDTERGPVRLNFPYEIVERWFPSLYPAQ